MVKNLPGNAGDAGRRCGFDLRVGKIPWRRKWQPIADLACKIPWRSLAGYSLWGLKGDGHNLMTEHIDREKQNS